MTNAQIAEYIRTGIKICTVIIQVLGVILAAYANASQEQLNRNPAAFSATSVSHHVSLPRTLGMVALVGSTLVGGTMLVGSIFKKNSACPIVIPAGLAGEDPSLVTLAKAETEITQHAEAVVDAVRKMAGDRVSALRKALPGESK